MMLLKKFKNYSLTDTFITSTLHLLLLLLSPNCHAVESASISEKQKKVVVTIQQAAHYIEENGKEKAITEFRKHFKSIFAIDYDGTFLASPIYPDLIGTNQINFKDPSGGHVVQDEIQFAKTGGGWLKGRWRKNHLTGQYECRKIYLLPMKGNYLIGSWFYYHSDNPGICLS